MVSDNAEKDADNHAEHGRTLLVSSARQPNEKTLGCGESMNAAGHRNN